MPQVSDGVQGVGWQQGSIVRPADNETLPAASVDRVPEPGESFVCLVAVTQGCDLVEEADIEPFIERIVCRKSDAVEPVYRYGGNPRLLHLQTVGEDGPGPWLHVSIHNCFRVGKETLIGTTGDEELWLRPDDARLLSCWIAKCYTRPALPDDFNARLEAVDGRLERAYKSQDGVSVTGVFVDVADDENVDDVPCEIKVRIAATAGAWEKEPMRAALSRFEERLSTVLDECPGVIVVDDDIQILPEDDPTLTNLRRFRRLDRDYRSLPERVEVEQPSECGREP